MPVNRIKVGSFVAGGVSAAQAQALAEQAALDALADDATVADAAATAATAAVDAEILGRPILEAGDILEADPVFAVVDENGARTWIEAGADGGLTDHAVSKIGEHISGAVEQDSDITGLSFAVVDDNGLRTDLELDTGGHVTERVLALWSDRMGAASAADIVSGPDIICYGDSMTEGQSSTIAYPAYLDALTTATVTKAGVGGDSSAGIAARQGGNPYLLMPSGGTFPASGGVGVTVTTPSGVGTMLTSRSFTGTVAGIAGTFSTDASNVSTFTRTSAGSAVTVTRAQPFYPDVAAAHWDDIHVYWAGNNNNDDPERVLGDIRAMIERQGRAEKRYLVLSLHNNTGAPSGSADYDDVIAVNARLFNAFGRRFVDTRRYLIDHGLTDAGITPTATDTANIADDIVPDSLRMDLIHLTATGLQLVAQYVYDRLDELEWV